MTTIKKTYGVKGLMEWVARIQCGKTTINVPFTGGTLTGYGESEAEYTTENPVVQAVIEKSDYFKSGRIRVLRQDAGSCTHDINVAKAVNSIEAGTIAGDTQEKNIEVASIEDARDYLADHFDDISKSELRSKVAIKQAAKAHGIVFTGIEL